MPMSTWNMVMINWGQASFQMVRVGECDICAVRSLFGMVRGFVSGWPDLAGRCLIIGFYFGMPRAGALFFPADGL
jgi:hypothetical protein